MKKLIILFVFSALCATSAYAQRMGPSNIPPDTPEFFMERYKHFIRKDERKAFKKVHKEIEKIDKKLEKLEKNVRKGKITPSEAGAQRAALTAERARLSNEEFVSLIETFWSIRDTRPDTPENEYKQMVDQRIKDINDEPFFRTMETPGITFRSNGGFTGDLAQVYLLHGKPDAMSTVQGTRFVPLMLWLYGNPGGGIRYAFLFYQERGLGTYRLFEQDRFMMSPCSALNEISVRRNFARSSVYDAQCAQEDQMVYRDLYRSMPTGMLSGHHFAWALFNFSEDSSVRLGEALSAPEAASLIARRSTSRVTGGVPELVLEEAAEIIAADCENCETLIPWDLSFSGSDARVKVARRAVDWIKNGDTLSAEMVFLVVMEGDVGTVPFRHRQTVHVKLAAQGLEDEPDRLMTIPLFKAEEYALLPSGTYRVTVYLRSTHSNRYNAGLVEAFTKE